MTTEPASHQLEASTLRISASRTLVPSVPRAPVGSGMVSAHLPLLQTPVLPTRPSRDPSHPALALVFRHRFPGQEIFQASTVFPQPRLKRYPGALVSRLKRPRGSPGQGPTLSRAPKQHHLSPTSCKASPRQPLLLPESRDSEPVLWARVREANGVLPTTPVSLLAPSTQHPNLVSPSWAKQKIALMQICIFNFLPA